MPIWISWVNPRTQKRERVYNYCDMDTPEGEKAIRLARSSLSTRSGIPKAWIPGFQVEEADWIPAWERRGPADEERAGSIGLGPTTKRRGRPSQLTR